MTVSRRFAGLHDVAGLVAAVFGGQRRLEGLVRLSGGSKKGVYRLTFDAGPSAILYVWDPAENYWPASPDAMAGHDGPFSEASGADLFEACHAELTALGVRVPRVHLLDRSRTLYPADVAVVQDVRGPSLQTQLQLDPQRAGQPLAELAAALELMHRHPSPRFGKVAVLQRGAARQDRPPEQVVLDRALAHLADAADQLEDLATVQHQLAEVLRRLAAAVRPRKEYGLIHGELGPDHVLLDDDGHPVLIDIEGVMYFDVEWEHTFLQLRFGEHYHRLQAPDLDQQRLTFYRLAMHLSLIAGPLRILTGDYPGRALMASIAQYNLQQALTFLRDEPNRPPG